MTAGAGSLWRWCFWAWPLATLPALTLVSLQWGVVKALDIDISNHTPPGADPLSAWDWFSAVILAPAVETVLLGWGLRLLRACGARPPLAVLASALLWGLLHGLQAWTWFIGPFWMFLVFASGWLRWSDQGRWPAFWAAALPHALNNATAMGLELAFPA